MANKETRDNKEMAIENSFAERGNEPLSRKKKITDEDVKRGELLLKEYMDGKKNLENKIKDNERWWKIQTGQPFPTASEESSSKNEVRSAWLFNSIANKHADFMDNFPSINILPRAQDDEEVAKKLGMVIPAVLEANDYEKVFNDTCWYKLKQGTGAKGIFWDSSARGGLGDISIKKCDLLNLFWEPGVTDIQEGRNFFSVELRDTSLLREEYPDIEFNSSSALTVSEYSHDESIDTSKKTLVVDWYYKKTVVEEDEDGRKYARVLLHYCKFADGKVLYASENDEACVDGFYAHGKYPFVYDVLFPIEDMPTGFGFIDVMKPDQMMIDKLDASLLENALISTRKRFFARVDAGINEEEFLDLTKPIVHTNASLGDDSIKEITYRPLSGIYYSMKQGKIDELKETSGNRDFSQGATASGVTAASAISALQEAGGKLSRDMLKASYRAFEQECYLIIELMRQFYTEPRVFRITGEDGKYDFTTFDNSELVPQEQMIGEESLGSRLPVFDIRAEAQKQSQYSQMAQNELALQLYGQGFFNPANAQQTIAAVEMMSFEGKEKTLDKIKQGQTLMNEVAMLKEELLKLSMIVDKQNGTNLSQQMAQEEQPQKQQGSAPAPKIDVNKTLAERSRDIAAAAASPR